MDRMWKKLSPLIHFITIAFAAGTAWAGVLAYKDVASHAQQIVKLQQDQAQMQALITDLRISTARIEQGVSDIKSALNIKHRED